MDFTKLLWISFIRKLLAFELLARKIKDNVPYNIIAMEIPVVPLDPVDLSSKDILRKKGRDRALPEGWIVDRPFASEPGCTSVNAPKF